MLHFIVIWKEQQLLHRVKRMNISIRCMKEAKYFLSTCRGPFRNKIQPPFTYLKNKLRTQSKESLRFRF